LRLRDVVSDVLFAVSALAGVAGVHKYIFGDFPKLWVVRDLPWNLVNPGVAVVVCVALAWTAARIARREALPPGDPALDTVAGVESQGRLGSPDSAWPGPAGQFESAEPVQSRSRPSA
jgi:hypothetical protein